MTDTQPQKLSAQAARDLRDALEAFGENDAAAPRLVVAALACAHALEDAVLANETLRTIKRVCDESSVERWKAMVRAACDRDNVEIGLLDLHIMPDSSWAFTITTAGDELALAEHFARLVNENRAVRDGVTMLRGVSWALHRTLRPVDVRSITKQAVAWVNAMQKWVMDGDKDATAPVDTSPKPLTVEETRAFQGAVHAAGLDHLKWQLTLADGVTADLAENVQIIYADGRFSFGETRLMFQGPGSVKTESSDTLRDVIDADLATLKAVRKALGPRIGKVKQ